MTNTPRAWEADFKKDFCCEGGHEKCKIPHKLMLEEVEVDKIMSRISTIEDEAVRRERSRQAVIVSIFSKFLTTAQLEELDKALDSFNDN